MDKNTIWAIVLSTLVIVGSYFLLPVIFGNKKNAQSQTTAVEVSADTQAEAVQQAAVTDTLFTEEEEQLIAQVEETEEEPEEAAVEKEITINTGFAEVVFTTKGGDIISYKLAARALDITVGIATRFRIMLPKLTAPVPLQLAVQKIRF